MTFLNGGTWFLTPAEALQAYEDLKTYIPDDNLRRRFDSVVWVPVDFAEVFHELNMTLKIQAYNMDCQLVVNPVRAWDKRFFRYKLSGAYLRQLLDLMITEEQHEGIVVIEQRLSELGLTNEDTGKRFEI